MELGWTGADSGMGVFVGVAFGDVVGADLDEGDAPGFAGFGEFADGDDVGAVGGVGFVFAEIDVVEGGGVDEGVGGFVVEHFVDGVRVGDVEFGAAGEGEDVVAEGRSRWRSKPSWPEVPMMAICMVGSFFGVGGIRAGGRGDSREDPPYPARH